MLNASATLIIKANSIRLTSINLNEVIQDRVNYVGDPI